MYGEWTKAQLARVEAPRIAKRQAAERDARLRAVGQPYHLVSYARRDYRLDARMLRVSFNAGPDQFATWR